MLTSEQTAALRAFADKHGRCWKQALSLAWERGDTRRICGTLYGLRNSHGPAWLVRFKFTA